MSARKATKRSPPDDFQMPYNGDERGNMRGFCMPFVSQNIPRVEERAKPRFHQNINIDLEEGGIYVDVENDAEGDNDEDEELQNGDIDWEDVRIEYVPTNTIPENGLMGRGVSISSRSTPTLIGIDVNDPVYPGSPHSAKDFARYILAMRYTIGEAQGTFMSMYETHYSNLYVIVVDVIVVCFVDMGDMAFATCVGAILSFLPADNFFTQCLKKNPSVYHILQIMRVVSGLHSNLRTLKYDTCEKGLCVYSEGQEYCRHSLRWKSCTMDCYNNEGESICHHTKQPLKSFWYMPIRDRITALLKSDMKNFFHYKDYRHTCASVSKAGATVVLYRVHD